MGKYTAYTLSIEVPLNAQQRRIIMGWLIETTSTEAPISMNDNAKDILFYTDEVKYGPDATELTASLYKLLLHPELPELIGVFFSETEDNEITRIRFINTQITYKKPIQLYGHTYVIEHTENLAEAY